MPWIAMLLFDLYLEDLPSVLWTLTYAFPIATIAYLLLTALYNLTLHPLRSHPGPLLSRAWSLPHALGIAGGRGPQRVCALHERYGPVVRVGPNHLSYIDPRAWRDVFAVPGITEAGRSKNGREGGKGKPRQRRENPKSRLFYREQLVGKLESPSTLFDANAEEHARLRRALAPGFSERAVRERHEPVILGFVDQLVSKLRSRSERGEAVDVVRWYNWTAFDVVGHLVFAEPFGCLEREAGHPFVDLLLGPAAAQGGWMMAAKYAGLGCVPGVRWALGCLVNWVSRRSSFSEMKLLMQAKLQHRLNVDEERSDLFEGLVNQRHEWNLDMNSLESNATLLAAAGSETTASLLSGLTFLLLQHPETIEKLKREVRASFSSVADITVASVARLPYLQACIHEGLRRFPPITSNLPRETREGGAFVAGQFVPEGTILEIQQFAMNHSSQHWHDPFAFRPERWLNKSILEIGEADDIGEKSAGQDRVEVMQVFSVGPRNCVGKNLAYAEMKLIMTRLIFEFDMELAEESDGWLDSLKAYAIWEKKPLYVRFSPVRKW